jgi:hypothetical protein
LTKLKRGSISIMETRPKGTGLVRGRIEGRELPNLENILSQKAKKNQEEEHNFHWISTGKKYSDH